MIKKKFPYNLEALTWDSDHNRNIENKYCYCGKDIIDDQPIIRCEKCRQLFHGDCIDCMVKPLMFGDSFGTFHCSACNQGPETFERKGLSWIVIVHLVIYNLIRKAQVEDSKKAKGDQREHYYFRWKEDVCAFIDDYWGYLVPEKQRSLTWNNTIASVLSTHNNLFLSGLEKFHQSAWWTLHKIEPPSNEKKSKAAIKLKPNLKKPLKRSKMESDTVKQKKSKKVKNESDLDLLDLSSLSELSSADEFSEDELPAAAVKPSKKKDSMKKNQDSSSSSSSSSKPIPPSQQSTSPSKPILSEPSKSTPQQSTSSSKPPSKAKRIRKASITTELAPLRPLSPKILSASPPASISTTLQSSGESSLQRYSPLLDIPQVKQEKHLDIPTSSLNAPTATPTTVFSQHHSPQDEWSLLQRLEHSSKKLPFSACRYKRKLAVRRLKRNLGISKLFDLDTHVIQLLRTPKHALEPISKETTIQPTSNQQGEQTQDDQQHLLDKITYTPYTSSFASRLFGSIRQRKTMTRDEPWLSSWNGRKLRPFIRRDYQSKPKRMLLMGQIKACQGRPRKKGESDADGVISGESIDYVYFQKEHLTQVNELLSRSFWEGIDVSESLLFPEFSIVALYKRHVIGCAFMTPEAYITYFAVDAGWGNASIGQFMLYHLFQTAISKDITLHVSANNNAMILYQKFGFKPEEFIVNFYDKYLPTDSVYSKNAFFLRLRR